MSGLPGSLSPSELYARYEAGVAELLQRMEREHPKYQQALVYQQRLMENLSRGIYGEDRDRDAERSEILSQLNALTLSVLHISFYELCEISAPLHASPSQIKIEFANRDDELRLLNLERLRTSSSPYFLISAPAGYGKTYLLRRLIDIAQSDDVLRQTWHIRYIDCQTLVDDPMGEISYQLTGQTAQGDMDQQIQLISNGVIETLTGPLPHASGRWDTLLIFDTVEQLPKSCWTMFAQLLYTLRKQTRLRTRAGYEEIFIIRIILAGRAVEPLWESYVQAYPTPPAPQRITLSPFDEYAIQDLIWRKAKVAQIQHVLDDQTVVEIADEVQYLSGGHPKIIRSLIDQLADRSFAMDVLPRQYFTQQRTDFVREYLHPVAMTLLESLPPKLQKPARVLSVFRRVNANTVQRLIYAKALEPDTDEVTLLSALLDARLLEKPTLQEPFYRALLLRKIIASDMAYDEGNLKKRYFSLNRIALGLYDEWIQHGLQDSYRGPTQRLLSVVEWLFHALQDESITQTYIREKIQSYVQILGEMPESTYIVGLIIDEITKDTELCYLARQRLGDRGIDCICNWLNVS